MIAGATLAQGERNAKSEGIKMRLPLLAAALLAAAPVAAQEWPGLTLDAFDLAFNAKSEKADLVDEVYLARIRCSDGTNAAETCRYRTDVTYFLLTADSRDGPVTDMMVLFDRLRTDEALLALVIALGVIEPDLNYWEAIDQAKRIVFAAEGLDVEQVKLDRSIWTAEASDGRIVITGAPVE